MKPVVEVKVTPPGPVEKIAIKQLLTYQMYKRTGMDPVDKYAHESIAGFIASKDMVMVEPIKRTLHKVQYHGKNNDFWMDWFWDYIPENSNIIMYDFVYETKAQAGVKITIPEAAWR